MTYSFFLIMVTFTSTKVVYVTHVCFIVLRSIFSYGWHIEEDHNHNEWINWFFPFKVIVNLLGLNKVLRLWTLVFKHKCIKQYNPQCINLNCIWKWCFDHWQLASELHQTCISWPHVNSCQMGWKPSHGCKHMIF
jgi:hypothetical protein